MYDVIYVPLGDTEALKGQRQKLIFKLVQQGWEMHGKLYLRDPVGASVQVQVLMRAMT